MTTAVMYDETGLITCIRTGSASAVQIDAEESGDSYLLTEESVDLDAFYVNVSTNQIARYPEKPAEAYVFDFSSQAWALDMDKAKSLSWERIKRSRGQQEFGQFQWGGYTFDCNEVSQRRIQGAVQLAALETGIVMDWTLADNTSHTFNATELQQIGQALGAHVNACHVKARGLRAAIDAATTETELDAINW